MPKSRGRKPKRPQRGKPRGPFLVLGAEEQVVFARSVRQHCEECGSTELVWGDLGTGAWGARTDGQRSKFTEAVTEGFSNSSTVWWCSACENLGIFTESFSPPWG